MDIYNHTYTHLQRARRGVELPYACMIYIHVFAHTYTCIHTYSHTHTLTHAHTHTHSHTHSQSCARTHTEGAMEGEAAISRSKVFTGKKDEKYAGMSRKKRRYATHCKHTANTLQTHCNTLQHTATHCRTLQHTAMHCNALQHTATHCNTLQYTSEGG